MSIYQQVSGYGALLSLCYLLTSCASKEVKTQLDHSVQYRGESYAKEVAAQSPFKTVSLSWDEATELMKERNPNYKKAITTKIAAENTSNLVKNFTHEVTESFKKTATTTLAPKEIAKAFQNPVAELPKQIKSLTDLKNISHSLEQKEWNRVSDSVNAQTMSRAETVKLHVLFCQNKILTEQANLLKQYDQLSSDNPSLTGVLKKRKELYNKQREVWLDSVRDFFNAEYYDVKFKNYHSKLSFYRNVKDPQFSQWQRWRALEHSQELVKELQTQHEKNKQILPGINGLKSSLGINVAQQKLADTQKLDSTLRSDVRVLIKHWRELKETQDKISQFKSNTPPLPKNKEEITAKTIDAQFQVYQFLEKEIRLVQHFWLIDERCWD